MLEEKHLHSLGYLGMQTQLNHDGILPFTVGLKRVTNIMRHNNIQASIRVKKRLRLQEETKYQNDNILSHEFNRKTKNEVWVTDTTEVVFGDKVLYKARIHVVLDLYGRFVLSSNISETETKSSVIETFEEAFKVEPNAHPLVHTDRGSAYCSNQFNDYLKVHGCLHSMSHPGHPWDNSPMERWWNDFKLIWINGHPRPKTLKDLEKLVNEAVIYFNTQRAYTTRKGLTPDEFRNQA